jgi:hypothetical protein
MDPRRSPYAPGVGTRPIVLAGRGDVLERFDITLSRLEAGLADVAPLLTGSRGSGKTVLLNELVKNAQQRGWFVASEEVIPGTSLSVLIAVLAHEVLLEMSTRHRVAANVKRVLGILKAFTAVSALGVTLSIDADAVTGTADTGIFSRDLRRLFIEIGELAKQQSVGVVFALDEVHTLNEDELDDLNSALHQTAQRQLPVAFIGAGLFPSWQNSGGQEVDPTNVDSYEARMSATTYIRLEPLDAQASRQALEGPASTEQVKFTGEALDAAVAFCMGNAWIIQLLGSAAWEAAERSPIDHRDVKEAMNRVKQRLNQWFFPRLVRNCSNEEIRLLVEIANRLDAGVANIQSVDGLDRALGISNSRNLLSRLAGRDLIELKRDYKIWEDAGFDIRFSMPMLGDYFRRSDIHANSTTGAINDDALPRDANPYSRTTAPSPGPPSGQPQQPRPPWPPWLQG